MRTPKLEPRHLLTALALLLSTLLVYRPGGSGFWLQTALNWMHFPVFAMVALCLFVLTPRRWSHFGRVAISFGLAVALGVGVEFLQIPLGRSASKEDVMADAFGAASMLALIFGMSRGPLLKIGATLVSVGILVISLQPLYEATRSILLRDAQFPVIYSGNLDAELAFISAGNARLTSAWSPDRGQVYTHAFFVHKNRWRIEFRDLMPNWTGYTTLRISLQNNEDENASFTVRIHDFRHRRGSQPHNDRFNQRFTAPPGFSVIDIPLRDIRSAPAGRAMNLSEIDALIMFGAPNNSATTLEIFEIRLD